MECIPWVESCIGLGLLDEASTLQEAHVLSVMSMASRLKTGMPLGGSTCRIIEGSLAVSVMLLEELIGTRVSTAKCCAE